MTSSLEVLAVEVWSNHRPITVINLYNPCKQLVMSEFDEIMEHVRGSVIWVWDFNARNPLWGSDSKNHNGEIVEDFLDKNDLIVINDERPTHW